MTAFSAWCVVATEKAFEPRELPYDRLTAPFVIAVHANHKDADQGATRAILMRESAEAQYAPILERERAERAKLEPGSSAWSASVAHETAVLNKITRSIAEIAQPREGKS
jgi:CRISPR/Cas system-associated endonuclease Cas3-HD